MRRYVPVVILFAFYFSLIKVGAQEVVAGYECKVSIDLVNVTRDKDRIKITITPPPIKARRIRYVLPAYLPGIGNKVDAGQFVHQFYAVDERGTQLKAVNKQGRNVILLKLKKGRVLRKVEYWIDDTWDAADGKSYHNEDYNHVPNAAGTSFDNKSGFMLNMAFMFGYFDGYSWIPYRVSVVHADGLFPVTALKQAGGGINREEFLANSYNDLIEYPVYYGTPDTCGFVSRNVYIDIAVYSETGHITSRQIRKYIGAQVYASTRFLGNIPPRHYKMIFYFVSPENYKTGTKGVFGGVAHRNSAVYYLMESADEDQLIAMVNRETSGNLLKTLSLLDNSQTSCTGDFLVPQVTASWWIGEGLRSYFTWLADLRDSVSSEEDFQAAISAKMRLCQQVKNKSLTSADQLMKGMKDPLVQEEYKAKAMLAAFMLDINITQWSGGERGLREIVLDLNDSAGFKADSLMKYIATTVSSNVWTFYTTYVKGVTELPVIESFDKIGWVYSPIALDSMLTFGQVSLYYDEMADAFFVRQAEAGNQLQLQAGDRLVSINGTHVDAANLEEALSAIYNPQGTEAVEVIFIRGNQNERVMATPFFRTMVIDHLVRPDPASGTDAQLLHARIFAPLDY